MLALNVGRQQVPAGHKSVCTCVSPMMTYDIISGEAAHYLWLLDYYPPIGFFFFFFLVFSVLVIFIFLGYGSKRGLFFFFNSLVVLSSGKWCEILEKVLWYNFAVSFFPPWTQCAKGITVFQCSGASFSPCAGQPCLVAHRPAANSQEPWGEAATGTAVARHALQPAEPFLTPVQRGGGASGLQQPRRGHPAAQLQQGEWGRRIFTSKSLKPVKSVLQDFTWRAGFVDLSPRLSHRGPRRARHAISPASCDVTVRTRGPLCALTSLPSGRSASPG